MIFKGTINQVLNGTKTQTRRPVRKNHGHVSFPNSTEIEKVIKSRWHPCLIHRKIWKVGQDYAVQPGRGKNSVGRIKILKIRREKIHEITVTECFKEGISLPDDLPKWLTLDLIALGAVVIKERDTWNKLMIYGMYKFIELWDSIYADTPYAFEKNPDVYVLDFEFIKGSEVIAKAINKIEEND